MTDPLRDMHAQTFADAAAQPFHVVGSAGATLPLQLVDVHDVTTEANEQFTLLFVGPGDKPIGQGQRTIRHPSLGEFPLFLVPVGRDARTVMYQAVFNRLLGPADTLQRG